MKTWGNLTVLELTQREYLDISQKSPQTIYKVDGALRSLGDDPLAGEPIAHLKPSGNDDSARVQEAWMDVSAYHPGGGVYMNGDGLSGEFNVGNLVIPNRVNIYGNPSEFTEVHLGDPSANLVKCGTMFKRIHTGSYLNGAPMLRNDPDAAGKYVRSTSNVESGKNQVYDQWTLKDVWLDGNRLNSSRNPGLFEFERAWGFTLDRVVMTSAHGLSKITDCNAFLVRKLISHYAPLFMFDCGDWQMESDTIAGGFGVGSALWLHGRGMWQGLSTNLLVYNAALNVRAHIIDAGEEAGTPLSGAGANAAYKVMRLVSAVTGTSGSGDTSFTVASHKIESGQPVFVHTSGTLPGRLLARCVYWVTRVDANTIKLSRTWNHYKTGTYIRCNSSGSGNLFICRGAVANLLLSGGAKNNQFNAIRCDQSSAAGILMIGAKNNTLSCMVNSNGYLDGGGNTDGVGLLGLTSGAVVPGVGMYSGEPEEITLGADPHTSYIQTSENRIDGIINGELVTGSGTTNSAQNVGIDADTNTAQAIEVIAAQSINHSVANFRPHRISFAASRKVGSARQTANTAITSTGSTDWQDLATVAIPLGSLGPNGSLNFQGLLALTAGTNAKYFRIVLGSTVLWGGTSVTATSAQLSYMFAGVIANQNSEAVQNGIAVGAFNVGSAVALLTGAENTATALNLKVQVAFNGSETCNVRLASFDVWANKQ
jgi:hypothetical protein